MKRTADAVVIGGGVMGCSILYNLALKGISNTLLLEMDALGSGSTSRSQAILRMHYSNEVTTRMAWESLRVYQSFEEVIGGPSGYTKTGYALIVDGSDRRALQDNVAMQQAVGVNTAETSPEELMEAAPALRVSGDEACAFEPESGYADTHSVTQSYAAAARRLGASIATQAPTLSIEISAGRAVAVQDAPGQREHTPSRRGRGPVVEAGAVSGRDRRSPGDGQASGFRTAEARVAGTDAPDHRGRGQRPVRAPRHRRPYPRGCGRR